MRLRRGVVGGGFGETFLRCQRPYVTKLRLRKVLRHGEGFTSVPADLAWRHSSPPSDVPREMALVRKTSRLGNFR